MKKSLLLVAALTVFVALAGYAIAQQGTMPGPGTMGPGGGQGGAGSGYYGMMGGQGQGYGMMGGMMNMMSGMMGGQGQNGGAWMQNSPMFGGSGWMWGTSDDNPEEGDATASPQRGFRRGYSPK